MTLDYIIVLAYLAGILVLGLYVSTGIKNIQQYAVANRAYPAFIVFATLSASFIGGGFTLGNAEKVFMFGLVNVAALWGFSIKELLVAKYIAPKMDKYRDAISVGDIMQKAYGKPAKFITGILAVVVCTGIVGAQVGAIGYVFEVFLNIPQIWGILLGCGIVIIYVTFGGIKAVVITDVVQFIILAVGVPLALFFGIQMAGGLGAIKAAIPADHLSFPGSMPWVAFISLFLVFLLGETLVPPYVQRLLLGKNSDAVAKGTLWSGLFSFPFFLMTGMMGLVALTLNPELNPNLAMPYVIEQALPIGLRGLVVAAIISVVMSSADSFLNSAAVAFTHDVIKPLRETALSEKSELLLAKVVTFAMGVGAVFLATSIQSIMDLLIYAYQFWAPVILIPLIAAVFGYKTSTKQFILAGMVGVSTQIVWNQFLDEPFGVAGLVLGVLANGITLYLQQARPAPALQVEEDAL